MNLLSAYQMVHLHSKVTPAFNTFHTEITFQVIYILFPSYITWDNLRSSQFI